MKTYGRAQPKGHLRWTKSSDIRDNLSLTLDTADPFFAVCVRHGALLTEMRYVRNHIAHANAGTRTKFRTVITRYYGGVKQGVTPGLLLLTNAFGPDCLLNRYTTSTRVIVRETLRA
jgi:hypothetical protein